MNVHTRKLAARISTLRKAKQLTLVELSKQSGIDQASLSRIENGKMVGTIESHSKIAKALGTTLVDLYREAFGENVTTTRDRALDNLLRDLARLSKELNDLTVKAKRMM